MISDLLNRILAYKVYIPHALVLVGAIFMGYAVTKLHPMMYLAPLGLLVLGGAIYYPRQLFLALAFFTPLSIGLEDMTGFGGIGFHMPTEPLMFGLLLLLCIKGLGKRKWNTRILYHPIAIAAYFNLFWILVTSITSTMPVVSFKFMLGRLWFVAVCFFMAAHLFQQKDFFEKFVKAFLLGLSTVVVITLIKHGQRGFDEQVGHYIMGPYFKDHTSYGAIIAFFFPLAMAFYWYAKKFEHSKKLWGFIFLILTVGIIMSYTRAAWLSLIAALGVFVVLLLKIKFRTLLVSLTLAIGFFVTFQNDIIRALERNDQDSSSDFAEHIQSMSNITTDASNLERLNRWACAIRMFEEKPVFGFGPGTYMFQYAPYQKFSEKTWISTNFSTLGNAHSEYLGPLSEQGVLGLASFLAIAIAIMYTAIKILPRFPAGRERILLISCILGMVTYLSHGLLNNFLDTDKANVPFWGFAAIILILDIRSRKGIGEREGQNLEN
ncbi:MAG: O-antigen ligase family protein [Bacteroidota bacterium]